MRHIYARRAASSVLVCFLTCSAASAQVLATRENDPYSRYGVGQPRSGTSVAQRGSGSQTAAVAMPYSVNTDNPASYSALRLTTYEGAAEGSQRRLVTPQATYTSGTATLSYLRLAFPVAKNVGIAIGLQPESRVYYNMQDTSFVSGLGRTVNQYSGFGGLNYGFIGAGAGYKGFRLGFNFGYLFGNISNASSLQVLSYDSARTFGSEFTTNTRFGGLYYKLGAQYETPLNDKLGLRLGATTSLQQRLGATRDVSAASVRFISGGGTISDTASRLSGDEGYYTLPLSYTAGAQVFGTQWAAGADFSQTRWSEFRSFGTPDSLNATSYRLSVGGEYTPSPSNLNSYFQRVTYRLGFYYGLDPVRLRNTDLNYYALTAGLSLPFKRTTDRLHTAIEIGRRGTKNAGLIQENFVRFSVGLSLNDRWFVKRRYD